MLFRRSRSKRNSKKAATRARRDRARLCRFEPLEQRRLLAAFDIDGYTQIGNDIPLDDTIANFRDYSGIAYSDVTDSLFIVDNRNNLAGYPGNHIIEYTTDGLSPSFINMTGFVDVESIIHMDGNRFAVVEERDQTANKTDNVHEFDITIIEIDGLGGTIVKSSSEKTITVNDSLLTDGFNNELNKGLEGLAYDPVTKYFYFAKEKENVEIFRVHEDTEVLQKVTIPGVTSTNNGILGDISDIHFVRTPDAQYGRLIMLSDDSSKIIMADVASDGTTWHVVVDGNEDPIELSLPTDYEGIGFTPGGFFMWTVLDGDANTMRWYRNFTSLTPDAAPDLDAGSDTGIDDDNITTVTTPSFSGTLARAAGNNSVPVKDAWVWLYVDDVQTGSAVRVDVNDSSYTLTAATLNLGNDQTFTIKAGESSSTIEADRSIVSAGLDVSIVVSNVTGDLTGNETVDFQDLTILLANWGRTNPFPSAAQGNLVNATTTSIDFADLTILLANWTGANAAGSPQFAMATPSAEYEHAIYSTSA